ncbi:MAG: hypothetical protein JSV85_02075 [Candidatus Bathyarchaeota archaeon]|nr:MAG: hypothetical protein JSV85_02075 [Candidatus Bathyarchaeota archaeon]
MVFSSIRLLCKQFTVRRQSSQIKKLVLDMITGGEMLLETLDDCKLHLSNSDTLLYKEKDNSLHEIHRRVDLTDAIVVDIDDTIIDTERRRHSAWCQVLGRNIPRREVESKGSLAILRKYAFSNKKVWKDFWMLTLCIEEGGADLLELDKPIPLASNALLNWSRSHKLVYLTGRTENMRQLTVSELKKLGFPTHGTDLEMFTINDWMDYFSSQSSVVETRSTLFSRILERHNVVRVVDDYPRFFAAYRKHPVPDKVGLLRRKRFSPQEYFTNGATRVVEDWTRLLV